MILRTQVRSAITGVTIALAVSLQTLPTSAGAQQPQKAYRVGFVGFIPGSTFLAPLLKRIGELGYVDGGNIRFEYPAKGTFDQEAAELVQRQVDLIFVGGDQVTRAAQRATATIPIVMVACDALAAGLVASLSRPGGNLTGVSCNTTELAAKRLQILLEVTPRLSQVGILYNRNAPGNQVALRLTSDGAQRLSVGVPQYGVAQIDDIEPTFAAMRRDGVGAAIVVGDYLTVEHRQAIADQATRHKLPTACAFRTNVEAGCLFSYGPSLPAMYRLAAEYVVKVLKGAKPADLPVQEPTIYELVLNLKTAKALGLAIPQSVRLRVDELIE